MPSDPEEQAPDQAEPDDDALQKAQEGKGYGMDESEREEASE